MKLVVRERLRFFAALVAVLVFQAIAPAAIAETESEFRNQVDAIYQTFAKYNRGDLDAMHRTTAVEMVDQFRDGLQLVDTIAGSDLPEAVQEELLVKLGDSLGAFYSLVNEGFEDLNTELPGWKQLRNDNPDDYALQVALWWCGYRALSAIEIIIRDVKRGFPGFRMVEVEGFGHDRRVAFRAPYVGFFAGGAKFISEAFHGMLDDRTVLGMSNRHIFPAYREAVTDRVDRMMSPLMGPDARRTDAAGDMADFVYSAVKGDLKRDESAATQIKLTTLKRILNKMQKSESSQNRIRNFVAILFLQVLAVKEFFHPSAKLPPWPWEFTTYVPFVSGAFIGCVVYFLSRVRRLDTGYRAAKAVQKSVNLATGRRWRDVIPVVGPMFGGAKNKSRWEQCKLDLEDSAAAAAGAVFVPAPRRMAPRRARN